MNKFNQHTGVVVAINRKNINTDDIIPKQYLKSIKRSGFSEALFDGWRYLGDEDNNKRLPNPEFVLNQERFKNASILLARENFACGSSREHAVWALIDYGFRVIIAPSFADIFYNNSFKSGLLPIQLPADIVDDLFDKCATIEGFQLMIDLNSQKVVNGEQTYQFEIDQFRKYRLLNGLDDIGLTLKQRDEIVKFESKRKKTRPWIFN